MSYTSIPGVHRLSLRIDVLQFAPQVRCVHAETVDRHSE
jgi:hypothetical protein